MPTVLTSLSPLPFTSYQLSFVAAGVVVEAGGALGGFAPFSNTKEIVILNLSAADAVRVAVAQVLPALPASPLPNSAIIPAGSSLTLAVGPEGYRNPMADSSWWTTYNGSRLNLCFEAISITAPAATLDISVTYVQSPGGGGGVTP